MLGPLTENLPVNRPAYYIDDWNGYVGERNVIFEAWDRIDDVVVLTGDYHESFASDLPRDPGSYAVDGDSVAVEFVTPSVTSPGYGETLALSGAPREITDLVDTLFVANFTTSNRWIKYHEAFSNGYGVVEFSRERAQFDFHFLDDRSKADSPAPVGGQLAGRQGRPSREAGGCRARGAVPHPRDRHHADPHHVDAGDLGTGDRTGGGPLPATGGSTPLLPAVAATAAALVVAGLRWRHGRAGGS